MSIKKGNFFQKPCIWIVCSQWATSQKKKTVWRSGFLSIRYSKYSAIL